MNEISNLDKLSLRAVMGSEHYLSPPQRQIVTFYTTLDSFMQFQYSLAAEKENRI